MTSAMADSSSITMMSPRAAPSELMSGFLVASPRAGSKRMQETRSDSTFTSYQSGTRCVRVRSGLLGVDLFTLPADFVTTTRRSPLQIRAHCESESARIDAPDLCVMAPSYQAWMLAPIEEHE